MIKQIVNRETITFVICAGIYNILSTLINWALLAIGVHYMICTIISYISGVLLAYFLNTKFVFKKDYGLENFIKFISVYVSNFFITLLITFVLVDVLKINPYFAPIICMVFGFIYNYTLSKFFVFKKG